MNNRESDPAIIAETDLGNDHFMVKNLDELISFQVTPGEFRRLSYWPKKDLRQLIDALESIERR